MVVLVYMVCVTYSQCVEERGEENEICVGRLILQ